MTARRYVSLMFLGRLVATLLALAGLLQLLDLLDRTSDVLRRGGMSDLARYAALRLPSLLGQMMPLATLVAALLTFRRLAMTLELTALRASGLGVRHLLGMLVPACLLATIAQVVLLSGVAPITERALAEWWAHTDSRVPAARNAPAPRRLWLRAGQEIVAIDRLSLDGSRLDGVLLVPRAADGVATARIEARSATHAADGWTLHDVRISLPDASISTVMPARPWPTGPSPDNLIALARPTEAASPWALLRGLRGEQAVVRGPAYYATRLHEAVARFAGPLLMVLLAVPVAFDLPRGEGQALRGLLVLALGLGYLLLGGLLAALGEAGVIPPPVAAWTVPILFAAIGWQMLMRLEEG